jgi:hypothetical protein
MVDPKLTARARQHYDLATGTARHDGAALTTGEREQMLAWIAEREDPIRTDRSDVYVAGMYLGAIRRQARRDQWDRAAREQIERERVAIAEREAARQRLDDEARFAKARAKIEFQRGYADGEKHARERAEANESIARVRRTLLRVNRSRR